MSNLTALKFDYFSRTTVAKASALCTTTQSSKPASFQIVQEEFLEDINNILNSGEVPNLFERDEYEHVLSEVRPIAAKQGVIETDRDGVSQVFISRCALGLFLSPGLYWA